MARVDLPEGSDLEIRRVWGISPDFGEGVRRFSQAVYRDSELDVRVREVARMRIAQINACPI